jgi:hypothetical protein
MTGKNGLKEKKYVIVTKTETGDVRDKNNYLIRELKEGVNGKKYVELENRDKLTLTEDRITKTYPSTIEAVKGLRLLIYNAVKTKVIERLEKDEIPDAFLKPAFSVRITSNPLRFKEKNLGPVMQSNIFGREVNEQKLIQMIRVGCDNINVIIGIIELLPMVNEYTKKSMGKYFIIELGSIFKLLERLSKINKTYGSREFIYYKAAIDELDDEYALRGIGDKLAAHLDPDLNLKEYIEYWDRVNKGILIKYWEITVNQIKDMLKKYYPIEANLYFQVAGGELNGIRYPEDMGFVPFDEFEI